MTVPRHLVFSGVVVLLATIASSRVGVAQEAPASAHERMVERLARLAEQQPFGAAYEAAVGRQRQRLDEFMIGSSLTQQLAMIGNLAEAEIRAGRPLAAIEHLDEVLRGVRFLSASQRLRLTMESHFWLGVVNLRQSVLGNCSGEFASAKCSLLAGDENIHTSPNALRSAATELRTVLGVAQADTPEHHAALWLTNIVAELLGGHPDSVESRFRIEPAALGANGIDWPRFRDDGRALGPDTYSAGGGVIADDFDGDGWIDLLLSSANVGDQLRLLRNAGDGNFEDVTHRAGLGGITGGVNMVHADYDSDGDLDVLVLRGAWLGAAGRQPNSLLRNDGAAMFTDVSYDAGIAGTGRDFPSQSAAWADYDHDGDLDLYVGNESLGDRADFASQLFRNEGDGTFTDVAGAAGVQNRRRVKGVTWGDYDNDGWADLYVSNYGEDNRLYRNLRDGSFVDVAAELGVMAPRRSFTTWFWDHDNDGDLDLFVNAYRVAGSGIPDIWYYARDLLGREHPAEYPQLYRNDGADGFTEIAATAGVRRVNLGTGGNFGDLDNDGRLDFYLATGYPGFEAMVPNLMYRGEGEGFTDITWPGGFGHLQRGQAVAFADLDNDGDQDVYARMGGISPRDEFFDALYRSPGFDNTWAALDLRATGKNRFAVGARVTAHFDDAGTRRTIHRVVGGSGSFGGNPLRLHLGLGRATVIDQLEIRWPAGDRQVLNSVPVRQYLRIAQGAERPVDATPPMN